MPKSTLDYTAISPFLAVGGHPPIGRAVERAGFTFLIVCARELTSLATPTNYPGVQLGSVDLRDDETPSTPDEIEAAHKVARWISDALRHRARVLVTCAEGRARSTYVAALTIHYHAKLPGSSALGLVKRAREAAVGPPVLVNPDFVRDLQGLRGVVGGKVR